MTTNQQPSSQPADRPAFCKACGRPNANQHDYINMTLEGKCPRWYAPRCPDAEEDCLRSQAAAIEAQQPGPEPVITGRTHSWLTELLAMVEPGPQRGPASVGQVEAQAKLHATLLAAVEEGRRMTAHLPKPIASVSVSKGGNTIDIYLDNTKDSYGEWIRGEGADITLQREWETGKVVGAHLPLYAKSLIISGEVLPEVAYDLESGAVITWPSEVEAEPPAEPGKLDVPDAWGHWIDSDKNHWWIFGKPGKFMAKCLDPETGMPDDEMPSHRLCELTGLSRGGWSRAIPATDLPAMNDWKYIAELHSLLGKAIGVIIGASMNDDVGDDVRQSLAAIADGLQERLDELRKSAREDRP